MEKNFKDQVAIVTGGSEGIGYGIAEALALRGALVYLIARTPEKLETAKSKILARGGRAEIRQGDIKKIDEIKAIIDEVYQNEKRLDIFVNNAGTYVGMRIDSNYEPINEADTNNIKHIIELDFIAPFKITHYLLQKFKNIRQRLKILTVLSQSAIISDLEDGIAYGTAKKALRGALFEFENQLEVEGVNNITLYRLYPNTVATEKAIPLIKQEKLQNPTTLESVINTAIDLLLEKTPTRDARIGYYPGEGIVRTDLTSDPKHFYSPGDHSKLIIDPNFNPEKAFN